MRRPIVGVGGALVLSLVACLSYSIASSLPSLSLVEPGPGMDATFRDLAPDWINLPAWRLKSPRLHTFCAELCMNEELMQ
jgi:hypothetical protein